MSCALLQIHWLRNLLGPSDGLVVQILQWAGLRPVEPGAANLEAVLRMKFFVLVAVVLKRRALRLGIATVHAVFAAKRLASCCVHCRAAHDPGTALFL